MPGWLGYGTRSVKNIRVRQWEARRTGHVFALLGNKVSHLVHNPLENHNLWWVLLRFCTRLHQPVPGWSSIFIAQTLEWYWSADLILRKNAISHKMPNYSFESINYHIDLWFFSSLVLTKYKTLFLYISFYLFFKNFFNENKTKQKKFENYSSNLKLDLRMMN